MLKYLRQCLLPNYEVLLKLQVSQVSSNKQLIQSGLMRYHELLHAYSEMQSAVCCHDSTSKPLVVLLYTNICPIIHFKGIESL